MLLKKDKPDNTKNGELKNNEPKKEVKILTTTAILTAIIIWGLLK